MLAPVTETLRLSARFVPAGRSKFQSGQRRVLHNASRHRLQPCHHPGASGKSGGGWFGGGAARGAREPGRPLVRLEWAGQRQRPRTPHGAEGQGQLLRHRPHRGRTPDLLSRLLQPRLVAEHALPARPDRILAGRLCGLSRRQPPLRQAAGAAAQARRPDLDPRLPPDPAGRGTAPPRRHQPHRLLPPYPLAAGRGLRRLAVQRHPDQHDERL